MSLRKKICLLASLVLSSVSFAGSFSDKEISETLKNSLHVSSKIADKMTLEVAQRFGRDSLGKVRISNMLEGAWKPNVTFLYNFTQNMNFHLVMRHPQTNKMVKVRNALKGTFANHGVAMELITAKKIFFFIGDENQLEDLDGVRLRGVASTIPMDVLLSFLLGSSVLSGMEIGALSTESTQTTSLNATYFAVSFGILPKNIISIPTLVTKVNWENIDSALNK